MNNRHNNQLNNTNQDCANSQNQEDKNQQNPQNQECVNPPNQINQTNQEGAKAVKWTADQQKAIYSRGKNIIVSASAGSGKTSVMIERIATLIAEGHSLNDMLIVTFTRASASDMKDKLARRLSNSDDIHTRQQLKQVGSADIGTLHSWCQRVLSGYFYKTDLDPDFSVIETPERDALLDDCLSTVIDEYYQAADPDFLDFAEILSVRDEENLKEILLKLYNHLIIKSTFDIGFSDRDAAKEVAKIFRARQAELIEKAQILHADTLAAGFERNEKATGDLPKALIECRSKKLRPYGACPSEFDALNERLIDINAEFRAFMKKYKEEALAAGISLTDESSLEGTAQNPSEKYLELLLSMAKRLNLLFLEQKKNRSKVDFNDLEHYTLQILKSDVGEEIKRKYGFVFVDEYQDINPLQNEIIDCLNLGDNMFLVGDLKQSIYAFRGCEPTVFKDKIRLYSASSDCEMIELNANHRSKKGILRYANSVFSRVMTDDFGGTDYQKTGRFAFEGSEHDIIDEERCVNVYLYQEEAKELAEVYNLLEDNGGSSTAADIAASRIIELLNTSINDKGVTRPVNLSDIAVLVRSGGGNIFALIKMLQDIGLRTAVSDSLKLDGDPKISALIEYLRLIDNRLDDTSLINSLKSGFGGFSDVELSMVRQAVPYSETFHQAVMAYCGIDLFDLNDSHSIQNNSTTKNNFENKDGKLLDNNRASQNANSKKYSGGLDISGIKTDPALRQRLADFYAKLDYYRTLSATLTVEELVGRVVTDFSYFQTMFTGGEASAELLESFLNLLTDFGGGTIAEFLQLSPNKHIKAAGAGDAVNIMTTHSSKGLEFPFVIIMDAHKAFNLSDLSKYVIAYKDSAAIKHFDHSQHKVLPSAGWLYNKYRQSARQREEEMRLLYVAITRAKYGLDIIACADKDVCVGDGCALKKPENAACPLDWLLPINSRFLATTAPFSINKSAASFPPPDKVLADELKQSIEFKPVRSSLPPKTYVTALLENFDEGEGDRVYIAGGDDDRSGRLGTLYHKAMELIDFDRMEHTSPLGAEVAIGDGSRACTGADADHFELDFESQWQNLDAEIKASVDKNAIFAAANAVKGYLGGYNLHKEQGFIADLNARDLGFDEDGSVLVQGVIDLIAIKNVGNNKENSNNNSSKISKNTMPNKTDAEQKSGIIIDYKTGAVKESHKNQLRIYALAAQKILNIKVEKTLIYSFKAAKLIDAEHLSD